MLTNSIFGNTCSSCGSTAGDTTCGCNSCNSGVMGASTASNIGNAAYNFVGDWVNIVVTLTILQSILGLVCNWNCGCGCNN